MQCQAAGHECDGPSHGRTRRSGSGGIRVASAAWGATGDRRHTPQCTHFLTALRAPTPLANGAVRLAETRRPKTPNWSLGLDVIQSLWPSRRRWSNEALDFVADMAAARCREAQPVLQRSTFLAWRRRWTRVFAVSCSRAFAASLISAGTALDGTNGVTPGLADLLESTS